MKLQQTIYSSSCSHCKDMCTHYILCPHYICTHYICTHYICTHYIILCEVGSQCVLTTCLLATYVKWAHICTRYMRTHYICEVGPRCVLATCVLTTCILPTYLLTTYVKSAPNMYSLHVYYTACTQSCMYPVHILHVLSTHSPCTQYTYCMYT